MATRIRTLNFLPEIFKTTTNSQFLSATLDQIVDQPNTMKIEGYIGSKFGYGINAKDKYVVEPTKTRTNYQLDPGVVFTKKDSEVANDFLSYPGLLNGLEVEGGLTQNNNRLFNSQFYSWDSFANLDKIINFNQYYWLPNGPEAVTISTDIVYNTGDFIVQDSPNGYVIIPVGQLAGAVNPTLTFLRGGTYRFIVDQQSDFWLQGAPGITGYDPLQPNIQTREVLGVTNNGANEGVITFEVPFKDAQNQFLFPGNNAVDVVSTLPFDEINGALVNALDNGIDGITSLNGLRVLFYNTGVPNEEGFVHKFYDTTLYDEGGGAAYTPPGSDVNYNNFEGGFYTDVSGTFYRIEYEGNVNDPVIRLVPDGTIPTNEKIIPRFGTQWVNRGFYRNTLGEINLIPYFSSLLDVLYYQDGTSANKAGQIKLIDSNLTNSIDVELDILGKKTYTSPNGVVFTNGLKVIFSGNIFPTRYRNIEYYVEGVGTAIELIPVEELIAVEPFTQGYYIPYDSIPYDIGNYDSSLYVPVIPDYVTIARNSLDKNAWSRSNRWFHIDVLKATANYLNNPNLLSLYTDYDNKARRPIIEFYPNLKLFNSGIQGKKPFDFFDTRTTDAFSQVAGQTTYYPDVETYTGYDASISAAVTATSTTITVPNSSVTGSFIVGQYVTDSLNVLPSNSTISSVSVGVTTTTLTVTWAFAETFSSTPNVSLIANSEQLDAFALFEGCRVVFSSDENPDVKNKVYVVRFSTIVPNTTPIITLTEADDGDVLPNQQSFVYRGYNYQGKTFYFTGDNWILGQVKTELNQPPLFDIFDENGISYGNNDYYLGTSFEGNKLFSYGIGVGVDDTILGFPIKYSSINNVGDISFEVSLNVDTFNYVQDSTPVTLKVNNGYVYQYHNYGSYSRKIGWETAVGESVQYQIFEFNYFADNPTTSFTLDVPAIASSPWPILKVFVNNVVQSYDTFTYTVSGTNTIVTFEPENILEDTIIEIAVLSDSVSKIGYYEIPINLSNNPFNTDITTVNIGDIRGQYQSIFYNNPNTTGEVFGPNNYHDLGNLIQYGNKIIQNSASLVLPGAFLRKQNHSIFNALLFNSKEYINFKNLLIDTINNTAFESYQTPAAMLDDALDQITASKLDTGAFFWSDMIPSKSPYATNTYTFANSLDVSIYPLSRIYDFSKANYYGILVYLTRTVDRVTTVTQLLKNIDYSISDDSPSLTITLDLLPGDIITIKEYNQTYGSYVPNTPTKLGLYPATIPSITLDSNYTQPTYFIVGHDGSYNKLYGQYIDGILTDLRDQVLFEYEKRVFNNLKLSNTIPVQEYEIMPGFFRNTEYSYEEILTIYSESFLNWVGQNRIDYQKQLYNVADFYTYNYNLSGNKINNEQLLQGYWRGIYQYFYDTSQPDVAPWEMLGYKNQPNWWENRYGAAPYTSENLVLWNDLAQGIDYNNGNPVIIEQAIRPQLLQVLPVDTEGNLVSPFVAIVGNYTNASFNRDWQVGDVGPAEFSYRRSSSWPFDLMRILALTNPAQFFNLGVDVDNYKYNEEFNQYLVNNRSHLVISDIEIYGSGTAKTSYINWIVDYEKQVGVDATSNITELLDNLDVRLVYRLAGFSDKTLLKFYVEKGTPNSRNASLLIPDESYSVLLYDNQPFERIVYTSVVIQNTNKGYKVYGNSQTNAYFKILEPKITGKYETVRVENLSANIATTFYDNVILVPYGTEFYSYQEVAQFLENYGAYLTSQGVLYNQVEGGIPVTWRQMVAEFLYWAQSGWEEGSLVNINPSAKLLEIDKPSQVVQPLVFEQQNFILNQNLYPVQSVDLNIIRNGTLFSAQTLNPGDTVSYGQFNISNFEHGIVFNNITLFNDVIYNLVTGLRQNRIIVRGNKTAEWTGVVDAQGFILNQDNILEWSNSRKYTRGEIVKYKNRYWTALKIIQPNNIFQENEWKETDYNEIQKGLLPNSSTRSYESTLYYDVNQTNLEQDANLLGFSLIGYRPRDYLALADLTDITQVNVYKNFLKTKGTRIATDSFRGAQLPQGGIDYEIFENWAIKTSEYGGVLNENFVDIRLNETQLTGNPSTIGLTEGIWTPGVQQEVPLYSIYNYGRPLNDVNVLPTLPTDSPTVLFPDAGYVNFDDVKTSSFFFSGLNNNTNLINDLYVNEYVWIANYLGTWQVYSPISLGGITSVSNNLNNTATVTFANYHNLTKNDPIAIINFNEIINGFYFVEQVLNLNQIIISLVINPQFTTLSSTGAIGLGFASQRISDASNINELPLLQTEFVKNKVWVDTGTDGSWNVLQKSINYNFEREITNTNSQTFGSAVAYSSLLGYLISDSEKGEVYRYTFNPTFNTYSISETLVQSASFGTSIAHSQNIFVISQPTGATLSDRKVFIYELITTIKDNELRLLQTAIQAPTGVTNWGTGLAISGDTNWVFVGAHENNSVYVYRRNSITGKYEYTTVLALPQLVAGDNFGYSISTDFYGTTVVIGAPNQNYDANTDDWGYVYAFDRLTQTFEVQYDSEPSTPQIFNLAYSPTSVTAVVTSTNGTTERLTVVSPTVQSFNFGNTAIFTGLSTYGGISLNKIYFVNPISATEFTLYDNQYVHSAFATIGATDLVVFDNASTLNVDDPIAFYGDEGTSGLTESTVYYVRTITTATIDSVVYTAITLKDSGGVLIPLSDSTVNVTGVSLANIVNLSTASGSMTITVNNTPVYVEINGTVVDNTRYAIVNDKIYFVDSLTSGDIIDVITAGFVLEQTFSSSNSPRVGVQFGKGLDTNRYSSEILIGAPFEVASNFAEGSVYRYTNEGAKYGTITGQNQCFVFAATTILINGYAVTIPAGTAATTASAINTAIIPNVLAYATNDNKLIISTIDLSLAEVNDKLNLSVLSYEIFQQLGINIYTQTQVLTDPHASNKTQFGYKVKFNEFDSVLVSAPVSDRYVATTFDQTDDANYENDTIFDNNATQWVDKFIDAGAVYMFDYVATYNETLTNIGNFVYAQSVNSLNQVYGLEPRYGDSLEFNENIVVIGSPNYLPISQNGQVVIYDNTGGKDWSLLRTSSDIVDTRKIQNVQLYSAESNTTLNNLDYFDPLQGKLLGVVSQNIDVISNSDPAGYNSPNTNNPGSIVWGPSQVGQLWFDTTNTRFVNYHQNNDVVYNSKYWGTVFPGSDPAVYSWISSIQSPINYQGPGTPYDISQYVVENIVNASGELVPIYYFWVRNSNIIFTKIGKTLSDSILESYILNPQNTGISYFAPIAKNIFALYNSGEYINNTDTVLHLGYSSGTSEDVPHNLYSLIRSNYPDDFLPGLPNTNAIDVPESLYLKLLDSLSGVDDAGGVVPDPYLPKPVQYGIQTRPRQSLFVNRFGALQNYIQYANSVIKQVPITETRQSTFLDKEGLFYNTRNYWNTINWWAEGFDNNTKSAVFVQQYADLSTLTPYQGLIATVATNGQGKSETYIHQNGNWIRIGLQNGTIEFSSNLYDYQNARLGFGDNFFDTDLYDQYPSEETRYIVRALNEEIFVDNLLLSRNQSLILLFDYITSETIESQNYLPWLNKTSFIDVAHTIRELIPLQVFQSDNQDFLAGYLNEVKPYHVVIKEFLYKYKGSEFYNGNVTDFDLPAQYVANEGQFVSPQLVYKNVSNTNQFLPGNQIWANPSYIDWYNNFGISLVGYSNYPITTLSSYVNTNSNFFYVDNPFGFPINGTIKIGNELIGYSAVDVATSLVSGLTRGINDTEITTHLPGEIIHIDLPPVAILDSGRGYTTVPKVTAYIDLSKYPPPRRAAVLQPVMFLDTILSINVIDPGEGYVVTPEIQIDPSIVLTFTSAEVNLTTSTIVVDTQIIQTGDLVKYVVQTGSTPIRGLLPNQYYYTSVVVASPTIIISLHTSYADALQGHDQVIFTSTGTGTGHSLQVNARAICTIASAPVRENNITLRFDRTTYDSQVTDWVPGNFYGSFYAGLYNNSTQISSSAISLQSTLPPIESLLASGQGATFEIQNVENRRTVTWSSRTRNVIQTASGTNFITIAPSQGGSPDSGYLGATIGFYVDMPIKFEGVAGTTNIVNGTTYYIKEIINDTDIRISTSPGGSTFAVNTETISSAGLLLYVGQVIDQAIVTMAYPNILSVTATTSVSNKITVPLYPSGLGGTVGLYENLPVYFVGDVFGGIVENDTYYITTIVDKQTITISKQKDLPVIQVSATATSTNIITCDTTFDLEINTPIIFTNMTISGVSSTSFGNIVSGQLYYVHSIISNTQFKITATINGGELSLSTQAAGTGTGCEAFDQTNTYSLTTDTGSTTMYVGLPVSPGQITGQQFSFYPTSSQYAGLSATNISLLERDIISAVTEVIAGEGGWLSVTELSGGLNNLYVNMPFEVDTAFGGLSTGTTYYVTELGTITANATNTSSSGNTITVDSTDGFYVGMPVLFTDFGLGTIDINVTYYVKTVPSTTTFTISATIDIAGIPGSTYTLTTDNGIMGVVGAPYIKVSTSLGGTPLVLSNAYQYAPPVVLNQTPTSSSVFDVSYILGGYRVIITNAGAGYAVDNQLKILGTSLGGTTTANDLLMTVEEIGVNGQITSLILQGTPAGGLTQYYLKVISQTELEVYEDPLLRMPVSGINFPYVGVESRLTEVTSVTSSGNYINLVNADIFAVNDPVVFTGNVFGNMILGQTYYILTVDTALDRITISTTVGGSVFNPGTASGNCTIATAGDFAYLPEPFYFNQSIVKYQNRVWQCIVSNNDPEFILGKWELIGSDNRELNALDRIIGYYQPTINMPGLDLTQLVDGIIYPNSTYLGNAFPPDDEYPLDVILNDQPFYPSEVDMTSITYDGNKWLVSAQTPDYTAIVNSIDSDNWSINKLTNAPIGAKDILYSNGKYVLVTNNAATTIFISTDGINWTSEGEYSAFDTVPYDMTPYDVSGLVVQSNLLNSVSENNGVWVAAGENFVISYDTYTWYSGYEFTNGLTNILNGVAAISNNTFTGYIVVGKGQELVSGAPVDRNIIFESTDGYIWNEIPTLTAKGLNAITYSSNDIIAVGENGVIYGSIAGDNWTGLNENLVYRTVSSSNELIVQNTIGFQIGNKVRFYGDVIGGLLTGTDYWIKTIVSETTFTLSNDSGLISTTSLTDDTQNAGTSSYIYKYPAGQTLNDVLYANSIYIAVGNTGEIITSSDGLSWTTQSSGTVENLFGISFDGTSKFIVVGDNNIILESTDNGVTWENTSLFVVEPTFYDVKGDEFLAGYGPEELVPGVVSDTLNMIVTTRHGTQWDATEYQHVGYGSYSIQITPSIGQTTFSFKNLVDDLVQLAVWDIDATSQLGTRIYETYDYTVNWINQTITLNSTLSAGNTLRIDIYDTGNGDQLSHSSSLYTPVVVNDVTDFSEILVDALYSASILQGSGVVRPASYSTTTTAIGTDATDNTILCNDVDIFVINGPLTFDGTTFGGVSTGTVYYVKTIDYLTNKITISTTIIGGVSGPTLTVTTAAGSMTASVQAGNGLLWTDPLVYVNGQRLWPGIRTTVSGTESSTNYVTCQSTDSLDVGDRVAFSATMFGGIAPNTTYYVESVVNGTQFTVTDLPGNPAIALTDATGDSLVLSNDFAIGIVPNSNRAKIIFADPITNSDYVSFTLFGETQPEQYGFTIPQTEVFVADGIANTFTLSNYVSGSNPNNAIVEVNGIRLINTTDYSINSTTQVLTLVSTPLNGDKVAITSYNLTERQYFNTQYNLTGLTVSKISNIDNQITPPLASVNVTAVSSVGNLITTTGSTSSFVIGQTIQFFGTAFGNILTDGTVYYVLTINSPTTFTISTTPSGVAFNPGTASGAMLAVVGGLEAVRITTTTAHMLNTNDIVRIAGINGSVQLNNNTYYVHKINSTQIDLYSTMYDSTLFAVNDPITGVSSYINGGYVWEDGIFTIITTTATNTTSSTNLITVTSVNELVSGTPIIFTGTTFGGIVAGTTYYVKDIELVLPNTFTISATRGGDEFVLSTATGTMNVTQWEQTNVDRLWVTINGLRVPSSLLYLNANNNLSILSEITSTDSVSITSMIPSATPNSLTYVQTVNKSGIQSVYRANENNKTWLVQDLKYTDEVIYVADVNRVTDTAIFTVITTSTQVGISVDKRNIVSISVFNNTTVLPVSSNNYEVVLVDTAPELLFTSGVTIGDSITITVILGDILYIHGEQIKFTTVDTGNNTIGGLTRGVNGTGEINFIPQYTTVYGLLETNKLPDVNLNLTWNSYVYNTVEGDPLQISNTDAAIFLNTDVT